MLLFICMTNQSTDEQIIEKITAGDSEMFSLLIDRYEPKLWRYVRYLIKDDNKTTDIVQDSFIKAYVNLNSFKKDKKFSSWIYRIAHNEAVNIIKRHSKDVSMPEDFDFKSDEDIEKNFEIKEIGEEIQECLGKIPLIYSEALELFFLEEKSYEEISDILRIPMGTVATRINRAKILMRKICKQN